MRPIFKMMPSATESSPMDTTTSLGMGIDNPSNLAVLNNIENKLESSNDSGPNYQTSAQVKSQVLPVVYIQTPTKLPIVTLGKTNSTNVIVKSVPPIQFSNLSSALPNKPISALAIPSPQNVLLSNPSNAQQSQQIVIQKSGGITNAFLTMINPVPSSGIVDEFTQGNATTTSSNYSAPSIAQKFVLASLPKTGTNIEQTTTTNTVQPKLAFLPLTITSPSTAESSINNFKVINPVLNFKIADGKLQSAINTSPITVMCDSNSISCSSDNSNGDKLICTEIIDLDSPTKDEKSQDSDITINDSTETNIENSLKTAREPKYGVSILKRPFNFGRNSSNHNSMANSDSISDLTLQKDITFPNSTAENEEKIIVTESKVTPAVPQKSGRRKSNFSLRTDFDSSIEFFDSRNKLDKSFEDNDISLTRERNIQTDSIQIDDDDDLEIKIIKDRTDVVDVNVKTENWDIQKMIKWENDVGILQGSDIKFIINEFNMIEYLTKAEYNNLIEKKNPKPKEKVKNDIQEEMRCVECGCFGHPSDFISPKYCSHDCQEVGRNKLFREQEIKFKKRKKVIANKKREVEGTENKKQESESSDDNSSNENSKDRFSYPWNCAKKGFTWSKYLEHKKAKAAPVKLFKDAFPYNRNGFKPGMKLEGIDPLHPSYFCVLTVAELQGYRLRLHFDGFSTNYDFWANADSMDIFPMGWCEKYGHVLHPPPGYREDDFNWLQYLKETKSTAAPKHLFANRAGNAICPNGFRVGMKLEAVDKKNNSSLICVATVRDMMDNRILVHFDSWDDIYDYWAEPTSPYIHPVGWCDQSGHRLTPPNDYPTPEEFTWEIYLRETKSVPAPVRAFKQKPACGFKKGMKLECVDKRVPQLIRVATVEDVKEHQIKIHFDGWMDKYSYWIDDDSPDIHPAGWCQKTGHPIEPPLIPEDVYDFLECSTIGCKGQGHVLGAEHTTHSTLKDCPYADENLKTDAKLPDRLLSPDRLVEAIVPVSREPKERTKPRIGRPPKLSRIETKLEDEEDKKSIEIEKKEIPKLNLDQEIEARIMNYLQDLQMEPCEKESWFKHSEFLVKYTKFKTDPRKWSTTQVGNFIESLPTGSDYTDIFRHHEIDGEALLLLTQRDIIDILNIKLGPAIKLYNSIVLLRQNIIKFDNSKSK